MKTIILEPPAELNQMRPISPYQTLSAPFMNRPILAHQIQHLNDLGITNVAVLTEEVLPAELQDGARWGIELQIAATLPSDFVDDPHEELLVLPGATLIDLDLETFLVKHRETDNELSQAVTEKDTSMPPATAFSPVLIAGRHVIEGIERRGPMNALRLRNLIARLENDMIAVKAVKGILNLADHGRYWEAHERAFRAQPLVDPRTPGFLLREGLQIGLDTRVDDSVVVEGQVLIGENSRIHSDVRLEGFVVIGDNVVIDKGTTVRDSIILSDTYVGTELTLDAAVVNQSLLYHHGHGSATHVEDGFILGPSRLGNRRGGGGFSRVRSSDQA